MSVVVLCPTRGRPDNAKELLRTVDETVAHPDTEIVFVVDDNDPALEGYQSIEGLSILVVPPGEPGMVGALNTAFKQEWWDAGDIVGFVGDDHRFRTKHWDQMLQAWVDDHPAAIMYGWDKHRKDIPTQCFLTANIPMALGYVALPTLKHLYVDNFWAELGLHSGTLKHLPDMVVEHCHPFYQTAKMDEGYARVNDESMYTADREAFARWRNGPQFQIDVDKVVALRG